MPSHAGKAVEFGKLGRRVIGADLKGGERGADAGLWLLRRTGERIGLTRAAAAALGGRRDAPRIEHSLRSPLAHRIRALCCGYESAGARSGPSQSGWTKAAAPRRAAALQPGLEKLTSAVPVKKSRICSIVSSFVSFISITMGG